VLLSFLLKAGGVDRTPWSGAGNESVDEDALFWISICPAMSRRRGFVLCVTIRGTGN
jgi:hypothetical protein